MNKLRNGLMDINERRAQAIRDGVVKMPHVTDVQTAIARFIREPSFPQTVALSGSWGVGKTYLWKTELSKADHASLGSRRQFSYCSLFGIDSLRGAREQIARSLRPLKCPGSVSNTSDSEAVSTVAQRYDRAIASLSALRESDGRRAAAQSAWHLAAKIPFIRKAPDVLSKLHILGGAENLVHEATDALIFDSIVCIDDVERRGLSLRIRDVLGLVSFLREERNCKVVLILNEDVLDNEGRKDLAALREKVFDLSIRFAPPVDYALSIELEDGEPQRRDWEKVIRALDITNIRVLRQVRGLHRQLIDAIADGPAEMKRSALYSIAVLAACHLQPGAHLPPVEVVMNAGLPADDLERKYGKDQMQRWGQLLSSIDWHSADELDREVETFVGTGVLNLEALRPRVREYAKRVADAAAEQELRDAWNRYHHTFEDNTEEVVAAIFESHSKHIGLLSPANLDSAVRLLRDLGRDDRASALIEHYVSAYRNDAERLDLESYAFAGDIRDRELRIRFDEEFRAIPKAKDLEEVLLRIARSRSWGGDDMEFLASSSVDDYERAFEAAPGPNKGSIFRAALQFGTFQNASERDKEVSRRASEALQRIARRSKLNALRLRSFGITP